MYATFAVVDIDTSRRDQTENLVHEFTIPSAKSLDGFVRGVWTRSEDGSEGRGIVVFDTEEHARAAADTIRQGPPPDAPVTFRSVEILEVLGEA